MSGSDAAFYEQDALWGADHVENEAHLQQRYAAIAGLLPTSARSIVELGSGDGRVLDDLAGRGFEVQALALDRSLTALRHQRRPTVAGSIDAVPMADRSADVVLCCEVLEHLPHPLYEAARVELSRVADRWVLLSVPNRENRRRAAVRCGGCGCEYNPMRHLRSFDEGSLADTIPGFRLAATTTAGPRSVIYPRLLRTSMERVGLLQRSGSPVCPQCERPLQAPIRTAEPSGIHDSTAGAPIRTTSTAVRRLVPKRRHRYWLCALYERVG